jgi:hypothetical protein
MTGMRRRVRPARRRAVAVLAATTALLAAWCPAEPAGAAITTFTMSPESGPPGTVVQVRGRGCAPGVLGSADANFVAVSVATFGVVVRAPVKADGRWNGAFTVPASGGGALGSPAPVTAACVSTGVASLTTVYTPRSFSVTAVSPPTTRPDVPPSTDEPSDRTVVIPGDTATVISVPPNAGSDGEHADGTVTAQSAPDERAAVRRDRDERAPAAATLRPAGLDTRSAAGAGGGLGWLGWSLLLILLLAALSASGYVWRTRHLSEPSPGGMA